MLSLHYSRIRPKFFFYFLRQGVLVLLLQNVIFLETCCPVRDKISIAEQFPKSISQSRRDGIFIQYPSESAFHHYGVAMVISSLTGLEEVSSAITNATNILSLTGHLPA